MKLINLYLLVSEETIGDGTTENPFRRIVKASTLDGVLVYCYDVCKDEISMTGNLVDVIKEAKPIVSLSNNSKE